MSDIDIDTRRVFWYHYQNIIDDVNPWSWIPVIVLSRPYKSPRFPWPLIYLESCDNGERISLNADFLYDSINGVRLFPYDYSEPTPE